MVTWKLKRNTTRRLVLIAASGLLVLVLLAQFYRAGTSAEAESVQSTQHRPIGHDKDKPVRYDYSPSVGHREALDPAEGSKRSLWDYHLGNVVRDEDVSAIRRQLEEATADFFTEADRLQGIAEQSGDLDDIAKLLRVWYHGAKAIAVEKAFETGNYITLDRRTYRELEREIQSLLPNGAKHMFAMSGSYLVVGVQRNVMLYFPIDIGEHDNVRNAWEAYQDADQVALAEKANAFNTLSLEERQARFAQHFAARKLFSEHLRQSREAGRRSDSEELQALRSKFLPAGLIVDRSLYTLRVPRRH